MSAARLAEIIGNGARGAALARRLARRGITTRAGLRRADVLPLLPRDARSRVLHPPSRATLAEADALVAELKRRKRSAGSIHVVGSVRRRKATSKDIDLLVHVGAGSRSVLSEFHLAKKRSGDHAEIVDTYLSGERHRAIVVRWDAGKRPKNFHVDLFLVVGSELPFALFHYSGPRDYNIRTRAFAKRHGWMLNQYGLFDRTTGRRVRGTDKIRTEADLARFIGLTVRDAIERARGAGPL